MDSVSVALSLPIHPAGLTGSSVRTMTVEEGTVLNIDGANSKAANRYKQTNDRVGSGIGGRGGGSAFTNSSDIEDGKAPGADRVSIVSGASGRSKTTSQLEAIAKLPWYRGVTCKDVRDIMPTVLILLGGLLIMIFVIPYAFSSVIKQLEAEQIMDRAREEAARAAKEAAAAAEAGTAGTVFNSSSEGVTSLPDSSPAVLESES